MYKSLSEMKPGKKFVTKSKIVGEVTIKKNFDEGHVECDDGYIWGDDEVDWSATNALYTQDYTAEIHALLERQKAKGLAKYGVGLEDGTVGLIEGINHAMEEAADILFYLAHVKAKLSGEDV